MSGAINFKVDRCPSDELSLQNVAVVNPADFENLGSPYVSFRNRMGYNYIFNIVSDGAVELQRMGFNMLQRKWAQLALNQYIPVLRCIFNKNTECIEKMVVELDFFYKKRITTEACDTAKIAESFSDQFTDQAFMLSQPMAFTFKEKNVVFSALVKEITVLDLTNLQKGTASSNPAERGILTANSILIFEKSEESALVLTGKNKGTSVHQSVIAPDWDFNKMGIGGLDKEFSTIFRRAFASRVFPPDVVEHLGVRHVKGIMLFGPPGTGKTLMARQIGKMLNAKEPKIVNGPQILDKYVGESEANIRKLFADAEEEEKQKGRNSKLHIIIFDEIDAICKSRGSVGGGTGVHDTVVNQLLTKIDGVEQLNNILVIGMTNRRDLIDEALLRPGRLEVQMEIGLPDEKGRVEILRIHTATMKSFKRLCSGVSLEQLSTLTKNFSGAELEGLVRAATSNAMNRLIKASENVEIAEDATEKLKVTMSDFISGLDDITPAFGRSDDHFLEYIPNGIIEWGDPVSRVINDGFLLISQVKNSGKTPLLTLLLEGPANSGKTALAVKLMMDSDLPFVKVCSPENMIGYSETMKIHSIKKVFDDAYKSPLSCVILDDIERLIDYVPIGPRFSNSVVQAILVLLKKSPPKGKRLMVIGTSSLKDVLQDLGMLNAFTTVKHVFNVSESQQLITVLKTLDVFSSSELEVISEKTKGKRLCVGIKMLLMLAEFVRQVPSEERVQRLISLLVEEGIMEEEFSTIWH